MAVDYINHSELRRPGRMERLIRDVEALLKADEPVLRADEQVLFKGLQASGYALKHLKGGWAAGRRAKQLKVLRSRVMAELVNRNTGLIYDMMRRMRIVGVDSDDLMSAGRWTLYRAIINFNPWRGFRFSTYACTSITRAFLTLARRHQRELNQVDQLIANFQESSVEPREPSFELQGELDRLRTVLADNRAELTSTERLIVEERFLHDPYLPARTLQSLGDMFGLSKEWIRQVQVTALEKLRAALGPEEDDDDDGGDELLELVAA